MKRTISTALIILAVVLSQTPDFDGGDSYAGAAIRYVTHVIIDGDPQNDWLCHLAPVCPIR